MLIPSAYLKKIKFEPSIPSKTTMAQEGHSPVLVFDSLVMVLHSLVMVLHSLVLVFTQSSFNFYTVQFYFFTQSNFIFTRSSFNLMIREEVKTNQMQLDQHEVRFHHEQWAVCG